MILDRDLYTVAVDLWALGCVLAETAQGSPIFRADNNSAQLVITHTRFLAYVHVRA